MRKYLKLSMFLFLAVLAVSMCCIGCGGDDNGNPTPTLSPSATIDANKSVYKVGALFSTTGAQGDLGVPERNTVEMMVADINAKGGINGHRLEVIILDDESNADKCLTLATRLIEQDQVLAIIGPTGSGNTLKIKPTINTSQITLVSCAASQTIVSPVNQSYWVFKTPPTDSTVVGEIYKYLQSINITKVALMTTTAGFGLSGKGYLTTMNGSYGITIVESQTFNDGDTNMQPQLTIIKGTDAQAVICWATNKESAVVASDMQTLHMNIPLFCSHGIANMQFIDQAGTAANGVIFPAGKLLIANELPASDPQKAVLTEYRSAYEAKYGNTSINTFGGHAYDALNMVVMALEELPEGINLSAARADIRDSIENIQGYAGTGGIFNMSPSDHLGLQQSYVVMIKIVDGKWTWFKY